MLFSPRPTAVFLSCVTTCLVIAACGGTDASSGRNATDAAASIDAAGHASISGSVTDKNLVGVEAFARNNHLYNPTDISIYVSSRGGICDGSKISPEGLASTTFLELAFPRSWPTPVGTYPIVSSIGTLDDGGITMGVFASLTTTDATCKSVGSDDDAKALEGSSVTITASTDALVTGSFDLKFPNGALRGTFSVPLCDVAYPSGSPRTCIP